MTRLLLPLLLLLLLGTLSLRAQDSLAPFWPSATRPFDTTVNSPGIELMPLLSADGTTLYFDRKYDARNVGGVDDPDDMYMMKRDNVGHWFAPTNVGRSLNTPESDLLLWLSRDGSRGLVSSDRLRPVNQHGLGIVRRTATGWSAPLPVVIDGRRGYGDFVYASIAPDERHMIISFAPDTATPDNYDLFLCNAVDSDLRHWSAPVNLGSGVNGGRYETAPTLAWDNRTLYFSSNSRDGIGESDLYLTRRIGESWTDWSRPINLGSAVNSPLDDFSITVSIDGSAVIATHIGTEHTDLYIARLPDTLRPLPAVAVEGWVHNGSRGVRGLVRAEQSGGADVTTVSDEEGRFRMFLAPGTNWRVIAMIPGVEGVKTDLALPKTVPVAPIKLDLPVKGR